MSNVGPAQSSQHDSEEFYYDRPFILITSASGSVNREGSIEREVTDVITTCVKDYGCFDVIDRRAIAHLFEADTSHSLKSLDDSVFFMIGDLASANEMMVVDIVQFWQQAQHSQGNASKGKSKNQGKDFDRITGDLQNNAQQDTSIQKNNIQTHLVVKIRILDIDAGQALETLTIKINHTKGSWEESRAGTIDKLRNMTFRELQKVYLLSPEVIESKETNVLLGVGSNVGIQEGMLFLIKTPDQVEEYVDEIITIPGKGIGMVSAKEISKERSYATILRQNGFIKPGYRAFEYPNTLYGLRIAFSPAIVDSMISLDAQFFWHPIQRWSYGLGIRLIRVTDSYGDKDFGFGMEGLGAVHLLSLPKVRVGSIVGLNFDLPFRKDDDDNTVYLPILSLQVGVMANIFHYWKTDISVYAGYRISSRIEDWQISSDEEEDRSIYWESNAPEINISGFFIQIGYRFIFF
jgi:hypothetical protein